MRRYDLIGLISLFCLLAACTPSQPEWRLVWEENFDQINDFDPAVWSKIPRGTADWNNYMSDFDSLYEMRKGNLVLRGIQNLTQPQDTAPFLTGGVYTKGKMGFMDGRLEIKAKLNGATGAWPAFWLLPQEGQWPMGGEIDIMERLNYDNIAYQTVHSHYTYDLGFKTTPPQGSTGPIHPEAYNVYAVEM